jgi:glycosyltransferase involved in cell wall biosynthesis
MSELAIYFSQKDNVAVHFLLMTKKERFYELPSNIRIYEPEFDFNVVGNRVTAQLKTLSFIRKKIKEINPDSVLSFGIKYNSFVLFSSLFLKTKVFVSDRCRPRSLGLVHDFLRAVLYRTAYGIICQTEIAKEIMFGITKHKNIAVIGNPLKNFNIPENTVKQNVILSVGRMIDTKRFDLLIEFFKKTNYKDWKLIILGDGPEMPKLQELVKKLDLSENVLLPGNQKDLTEYYKSSKIFAFTSNSEGFPNALGEAMVAGLAPICFNFVAGSTDLVINDKDGFLIPMGENELFVKKLQELMENENLQKKFGLEAKSHCEKFSLSGIGEQYYKFLTQ